MMTPEERAKAKKAFEEFVGKIGENYNEDDWLTRFGIFVSGWQAGVAEAVAAERARLQPYKDWFDLVHEEGKLTKRTRKAAYAIRARGESDNDE